MCSRISSLLSNRNVKEQTLTQTNSRGTSFRAWTDNGADGASLYRLPSFASFQIRAMPQSLGQPHQKIHWRRPGRATPPAELRDLLLDSGQSCQAPVLTVFGSAAADWLLIREQDFNSAVTGRRYPRMDNLATDAQEALQSKDKLDCRTRMAGVVLVQGNFRGYVLHRTATSGLGRKIDRRACSGIRAQETEILALSRRFYSIVSQLYYCPVTP